MCCDEILWEELLVQQHFPAILLLSLQVIIQKFTIWTDVKYLRSAELSIPPLHTHGSIDSLMSCEIYFFSVICFVFFFASFLS